MRLNLRAATAIALLIAISGGGTAFAQKQGGILRMYSPDSPASMSILEATVFAEGPMMGVFNNLVMFDQHAKQNSLSSIVPDLATGGFAQKSHKIGAIFVQPEVLHKNGVEPEQT